MEENKIESIPKKKINLVPVIVLVVACASFALGVIFKEDLQKVITGKNIKNESNESAKEKEKEEKQEDKKENPSENKTEEKKNERQPVYGNFKASDYVGFDKPVVKQHGAGKKIFTNVINKKLPERLFFRFEEEQGKFNYSLEQKEHFLGNNKVIENVPNAEVAKNVLSLTNRIKWTIANGTKENLVLEQFDMICENIDLEEQRFISDTELLERFGIKKEEMLKKIYEKIGKDLKDNKLIYSLKGNVDAKSISKEDFIKNAEKYAQELKKVDVPVKLYIKDGKLHATYKESTMVAFLGLDSHMGMAYSHRWDLADIILD